MSNQLNILAPTRYPWTFNGPRHSVNHIDRRDFIPLNKLPMSKWASMLEGATVLNPFPLKKFDLIHAFNRIPIIHKTPFIVGFESHLPRMYGHEKSSFFDKMSQKLASDKCRAIIPFSQVGMRIFLNQHKDKPGLEDLKKKKQFRYPNIIMPGKPDQFDPEASKDVINLVFVGNHFARKGGSVCERLAQKARQAGLPVHIHIVSNLTTTSWIEPTQDGFFDRDVELVDELENVTHHNDLSNDKIEEMVDQLIPRLEAVLNDQSAYLQMRQNAFMTAQEKFCSKKANQFWDGLYTELVG